MGFWDIFRKKQADPVPAHAPGAAPEPEPIAHGLPPDVAKLVRIGLIGGPTPEEATYLFAQVRATPDEARAVEELVRVAQQRRLPEPLLLALGAALVDRGEPDIANRVLANATSS